ncbi:MAG TPA: HEAT repeat domain-containing protein [Gemmatimonadaceae bacterium]|nr:HEAT repeat domain-containing protein [Gemmatimonadaceae bacterium]
MLPTILSGGAVAAALGHPMFVLLLKATIILVAALGITLAMQRGSAGARHLVWLVALATLLVVPAFAAWAPLRVEILPPEQLLVTPARMSDPAVDEATPDAKTKAPEVGIAATSPTPSRTNASVSGAPESRLWLSGLSLLVAIWAAVVLAIGASLAWSALVVRRIVRRATPLDTADWTTPLFEVADRLELDEAPRLLRSEHAKMPFACGIFAPTIVFPAECDGWSIERRRAVLLHELAHVRRHDLLGHTLGRLACAIWWFHPLVWTAAKQLRAESERACDDLALSCGTRATDYAEHLLDIVTSVRRDATPSVALAMARRKEFEGRMLAILDPELQRATPGRLQSAGLAASLFLIALVVGAAAPAPRAAASQSAAVPAAASSDSLGYEQHSRPGRIVERTVQSTSQRTVTQQQTTTRVNADATARAEAIAEARAGNDPNPTVDEIQSGEMTGEQLRALITQQREQGKGKGARDDRPALLANVLKTDSNAELRRVAAWGLSEYTETQVAVDALAWALRNDKDEDVREMAAWALGEGGGRGNGTDALVEALKSDASTKVRETAAWALGEAGDRSAVPALAAALSDKNTEIRQRAAWALGEIGPRQAPPELMALLKDPSPETRSLAAWALHEIEDPAAVPALQAALNAEKDTDLQLEYIRALAAIGEKSVDAIRGLLTSSDPRIKSMAVRALAGGDATGPWPWPWPQPRPFP